jgi:hypothetical protein
MIFPCLVVVFASSSSFSSTSQRPQAPIEAYSYHLFLSRTPVKQANLNEFSHVAGRSANEQLGVPVSDEEMKASSPSPKRSQQDPQSSASSSTTQDNQPIIVNDNEHENKKDEDTTEV